MSNLSQFFSGANTNIALVPIELFMVAGGGGGSAGGPAGPGLGGSGGGGGTVMYKKTFAIIGKSYTISVGAGGAAGSNGSNTSFANEIVMGGGGGATYNAFGPAPTPWVDGRIFAPSGGLNNNGAPYPAYGNVIEQRQFINRTTDINVSSDGFYTICGFSTEYIPYPVNNYGGSGAGTPTYGSPSPFIAGSFGGYGVPAYIIGIASTIAGGGGGGGYGPTAGGAPGNDGGGNGSSTGIGGTATVNTGGGGGGGGTSNNGGAGGSGFVVVRYPTSWAAATVTGNTPTPAQPGYNVYRWNSGPGTITFNAT